MCGAVLVWCDSLQITLRLRAVLLMCDNMVHHIIHHSDLASSVRSAPAWVAWLIDYTGH